MKAACSVKTKIVAFLLTLITLLGAFPITALADNTVSESGYAPPTGEDIRQALGTDGRLIYYNDFEGSSGSSLNTGAVTDGITKGLADRGGGSSTVKSDPVRSGKALNLAGGQYTASDGVHNKSNVNLYAINNATPAPENSGKSFVWSADVLLGDKIANGGLVTFMCSLVANDPQTSVNEHFAIQVQPLLISQSGGLYYGSSYAGSRLLTTLSKDYYTNVAVHVNPTENTYDVYINGVLAVENYGFLTDAQVEQIKGYNGFENGFGISQVTFYRDALAKSSPQYYGSLFFFDNVTLYISDTFLTFISEAEDEYPTENAFTSTLKAEYFEAEPTFKSESKYWVNAGGFKFDDRNTSITDGTVLLKGNGLDSQYCVQLVNDANTDIFAKNLAGADIAMTFDIRIHSESPSGCGILSAWAPYSTSSTASWQYHLLTFNYDKDAGTCGLYLAGSESWVAGTEKLCDLPTDEFVTVQIAFDFGEGRDDFYVYMNGKQIGASKVVSNKTNYGSLFNSYDAQNTWASAIGESARELNRGFMFNGYRFRSQDSTLTYSIRNTELFYYDSDADGDITEEARAKTVLGNYFDFENETVGVQKTAGTANYNSSPLAPQNIPALTASTVGGVTLTVDDGRGGKALKIPADGGERFFQLSHGGTPATKNSGKSFVISADFKWDGKSGAGFLFGATARYASLEGYSDVNAQCIFIDAAGRIYYSQKNGAVLVNEWTAANQSTYSYGNPDYCIGQLSTTEFTSIAIAVDVPRNTFDVYIDGRLEAENLGFMPRNIQILFSESDAYPNGFGFAYSRIYLQNIILDNAAMYFGKAPVSKANGFVKDGGGFICLYENGKKVMSANSPDGFITVENGYCKEDGKYVRSLKDCFCYVNGDLVPVNGVYKGFYRAGSLLGKKNGRLYFYNEYACRVTLKDGYYTGSGVYSFDNYGVASAANGFVHMSDGVRYCVNGVCKTGLFTVSGKTYFALQNGILASGVINTESGFYFFDKSTHVGRAMSVPAGSIVANDDTGVAYTDLETAIRSAASGSTLKLISDISTGGDIFLSANGGITLDLNGKSVRASTFAALKGITLTDSAQIKGAIYAKSDKIALYCVDCEYLPVYDTAVSGMRFYRAVSHYEAKESNNTLTVFLQPSLEDDTAATKAAFSGNATVTVFIKATRSNGEALTKELYFSSSAVSSAYTSENPLSLKINCIDAFTGVEVSYAITTPLGQTAVLGKTEFVPEFIQKQSVVKTTCSSVSRVTAVDFSKISGITTASDSTRGTCLSMSSSYTSKSVTLPTPIDFHTYKDYHTLNFSVYSAKKTDAQISITLKNSKSGSGFNQSIIIPLNFTGWRDIAIKIDAVSVNFPLPTLSGFTVVQSIGTAGASFKLSNITLQRENLVFDTTGVDVNSDAIYSEILQNYKDYTLGPASSRELSCYVSRKNAANTNCKNSWASFKATYTGTDMTNGLFGIDMRMPSNDPTPNNGYTDWYRTGDLSKMPTLYQNIYYMAQGYAFWGSDYYENPELLADIKAAIEYGYKNYYGQYILQNGIIGNWHEWRIGVPWQLLGALIFIKDDLTQAEINKYLAPLDLILPFPVGAAANLANMAYVCVLAGALEKDYKRIATAQYFVNDIYKYVTIDDMGLGTDGGFFTDGSFVQHNVTPYHGSYGVSLINTVPTLTFITNNTAFATPEDKLEIQARWILDSFAHVIYNNKLMSTTWGRAAGTNSEQGGYNSVIRPMVQMLSYVPDSVKDEFRSYVRTQMFSYGGSQATAVPLAFYHYAEELFNDESVPLLTDEAYYSKVLGNMCRTVQHGKEYGVAISLSSTRIAKYESINGANKTGWYHGDGLIYIYTPDTDYDASFYFYANPYIMPGTTVNSAQRVRTNIHPAMPNKYDFAGGVVQGKYSVTGYMLGYDLNNLRGTFTSTNNAKIEARKSYFLFDNEIVCIGSGITDASGTTVRTAVENRRWRDADKLYVNGREISDPHTKVIDYGEYNSSDFYSAANAMLVSDYREELQGVSSMYFTNMGGYVFLDKVSGNSLKYSKTTVTGHETLGTYASESHLRYHGVTGNIITNSFLEIVLEHGSGNSSLNGSYEYVYLPEASLNETTEYANTPDVKIISKANTVHAVLERSISTLGAVFFEAETLSVNEKGTPVTRVKTSAGACVMLFTDENGSTTVSVSDPTQTLESLTLEIDISSISSITCKDSGVNARISGNTLYLTVNVAGACSGSFNITVN